MNNTYIIALAWYSEADIVMCGLHHQLTTLYQLQPRNA